MKECPNYKFAIQRELETGSFNFTVFESKHDFLDWCLSIKNKQHRNFHELILSQFPFYEFYDIDFDKLSVSQVTLEKMLSDFLKNRKMFFKSKNIPTEFINNECYITEACKYDGDEGSVSGPHKLVKISFHIVFKNIFYNDYFVQFYREFETYLKEKKIQNHGIDFALKRKDRTLRT